jgi:DNA-binding transcriptional regulator YiaG
MAQEVRVAFSPLRKEVWGIRGKLSNLLRGFAPLNRWAKEISESRHAKLAASSEEIKASRFTPERIRHLREKLGISQRELGVLVGAKTGAVFSWEKGKRKKGYFSNIMRPALAALFFGRHPWQ